MPGSTPLHALPYPLGSDLLSDGDNQIKSLAEKLEVLLTLPAERLTFLDSSYNNTSATSETYLYNGPVTFLGGLYDFVLTGYLISTGNCAGYLRLYVDGVMQINRRWHTNGATSENPFSRWPSRITAGSHTIGVCIIHDSGGVAAVFKSVHASANRVNI